MNKDLKESAECVEDASEQLQKSGIKSLDNLTRKTKTRVIYDRTQNIRI